MTLNSELRQRAIEILLRGDDLPSDWAQELFPPERREMELCYWGKQRAEEIISETMPVPLQAVSSFGHEEPDAWTNMLVFGDNLQVMRHLLDRKRAGHLKNPDGSDGIRLVYIDPPFATRRDFQGSLNQRAYNDKLGGAEFVEFLRKRLVLLRDLLADDGAIYVHLDQKKVHYLKVVMDDVFGESNFRNEIIWHYKFRMMDSSRQFNRKHDSILFYARSGSHSIRMPREEWTREEILRRRKQEIHKDSDGREWLWMPGGKGHSKNKRKYVDDIIAEGKAVDDVWDMPIISSSAAERTGYPTQKPEQLVERVIAASSQPGDIVLDCFAGSGTTLAVAEKLGRRWIGIDSSKFAIYTVQKRLLTPADGMGKARRPRRFTLFNAGLYDFSKLRELDWSAWLFFALELFECRPETHRIAGVTFQGKRHGAPVLVHNHIENPKARIDEGTVDNLHTALGERAGQRVFIVAPRSVFRFQQDYIERDGTRYYALRIPYSFIDELHKKGFSALTQPRDPDEVNTTVESVGFDFIEPPTVEFEISSAAVGNPRVRIASFQSNGRSRSPLADGFAGLSMVMVDLNYDGQVLDLDAVHFSQELAASGWTFELEHELIGRSVMVVVMDIYGNESRRVLEASSLLAGTS